jgi:hypothetical protein
VAFCLLLGIPAHSFWPAQSSVPNVSELWQAPDDLAARNLLDGPWGSTNAPDPNGTYTFVKPKTSGSSPGMTVRDQRGRTWKVKQGPEAQPEVVVSHVLSAIGYHQPPVYFLRSFTMMRDGSGPRTTAGGRFRLAGGSLKNVGKWMWEENPFVGTQPYRGLLVVLVMFNSADLKNSNNTVYELTRPQGGVSRWFVVRDLGTSLGETGRFAPEPDDIAKFERHPFIQGVHKGFVDFAYGAVHNSLLDDSITPADVQWASRLLGGLSDRQWHDAFRGAGYDSALAERYIRRLRQKIDEGARVR